MIYLTEEQMRPFLSMDEAIQDVESAFLARANGRAFDIPRQRARTPGGHLNIMQGASLDLNLLGFKAYYVLKHGHTSLLQLIDRTTARLEAIFEAHWLGQMRTGAATAVAAKYLARHDSGVVGMFGSGRQAITQLEAICRVRDIREVKVFSRDPERLAAFCDIMGPKVGVPVRPARSAQETVRGSDILITITRGEGPVFDGCWLEPGQFIAAAGVNAIDRREIDLETVRRADVVVVDSRDVARLESGDLQPGYEAGLIYWENVVDMADVVTRRHAGRGHASQIILFESHGMALQDIYCGARVLNAARAAGAGTQLPPKGH